MSMPVEPIRPFAESATLLDAFRPPPGKIGTVGMLTAMTADDETLEAITEAFTNASRVVRLGRGDRALYLLLDGSAQSTTTRARAPGVVPGLIELARRSDRPSGLLHAKVALLGFGTSRHAGPDTIRVVIATSNWTRASVSGQHELIWTIDVPVGRAGASWPQERRDAIEVAGLLRLLLERDVVQPQEEHVPAAQRLLGPLHDLLGLVASFPRSAVPSRIVHTVGGRLWPQIEERLASLAPQAANLVLCGSGSWDRPDDERSQPAMLGILEGLRGSAVSKKADLVAVVEPSAAAAVGRWLVRLDEDEADACDWVVVQPSSRDKLLHAKYILVGREANGCCTAGTLYIGSANLTPQAMLQPAGRTGNVECGVVFETTCTGMRDVDGDRLDLTDLLFEGERIDRMEIDATPSEPDVSPDALPALCPIAYAIWDASSRTLTCVRQQEHGSPTTTAVTLHTEGGRLTLDPGVTSVVLPDGITAPSSLKVECDSDTGLWSVPLLRIDGGLVAPPQPPLSIDDALDALLSFPDDTHLVPEQPTGSEEPPIEDAPPVGRPVRSKRPREYPMLALAEFIERIARRQVTLDEHQVEAWLDHMDLVLATVPAVPWAGIAPEADAFPGPLFEDGFAPPTLNGSTARYRSILMHHATRWSTSA